MSWPKPDVPIMPQINRPKILNWLIVFFLYAFFIFTLIWFNRDSEKMWQNFFVYMGAAGLLFVFVLAFRIYFYVAACYIIPDRYTEAVKNFHQSWQDWANQSIAVMDSYFLTPNHIDSKHLQSTPIEPALVLKFDKLSYGPLFTRLAEYLGQLPNLPPLKITILINQDDIEQRMVIEQALTQLPIPINSVYHFIHFKNEQLMNQLVDQNTSSLELIIVANFMNAHHSEFIGYFLLAPKNGVQNASHIQPKAHLLRSLPTDKPGKAIAQLIEMQPTVIQCQNILMTHVADNQPIMVNLLTKLSEHRKTLPEQLPLDKYTGVPSTLSYWLALHFACDMAQDESMAQLVLSQFNHQTFLNLVTTNRSELQ